MCVTWDGRTIAPKASFGIQAYGLPGVDGAELIGQADDAMYRIKRVRARLGNGRATDERATLVPPPSLATSPRAAEGGRGLLSSDSGKASGRCERMEDRQ